MQNLKWTKKVNEIRYELGSFAKKNQIPILKYRFNEEGKVLLHFMSPKIAEQYKDKIEQFALKHEIEIDYSSFTKRHILIRELQPLLSPSQRINIFSDESESKINVYLDSPSTEQTSQIVTKINSIVGEYEVVVIEYDVLINSSKFEQFTIEQFKEMMLTKNNGSVDWEEVAYSTYVSLKKIKEQLAARGIRLHRVDIGS